MSSTISFDGTRLRALALAPMRGEGLTALGQHAEVVLDPWIDQDPIRIYGADDLAARVEAEDANILIVEADAVRGPVLDLPLRVIGVTRATLTNVDVEGATAKGIPVLRAPGRNRDAVAELAIGLLFAVSRRILPADADTRNGRVYAGGTVPYQRYRAWEMHGRTVGIVGLGAVGRAAKWRFEGLGMQVIAHDPYADDATHDLDELLGEADVVSMHAPVTDETTKMMGAEQFAAMKEGAIYLNTARAQLHDVDALVEALRRGHLSGAGLDHFEGEHLPVEHPLVAMSNVVLTPHIGGATYDTEANQSRLIANGLITLLAGGQPDNLANPEVLA